MDRSQQRTSGSHPAGPRRHKLQRHLRPLHPLGRAAGDPEPHNDPGSPTRGGGSHHPNLGPASQRLPVLFGTLDVLARTAGYVRCLLLAHAAGAFGGNADDEAVGRELAALGDDGAGGDDGALTDLRAVEDGTPHPHETMVLDLAPVHDRIVAEDASLANDRRVAWVGVEHAAVLHIGPGPNTDGLRVAAQHGPVPDTRFFAQVDVTDDAGSRRDPGRPRDLREGVAVREHIAPSVQIQRGALTFTHFHGPFRLPLHALASTLERAACWGGSRTALRRRSYFHQHRVALAAAGADGSETLSGSPASQLVEERRQDARA